MPKYMFSFLGSEIGVTGADDLPHGAKTPVSGDPPYKDLEWMRGAEGDQPKEGTERRRRRPIMFGAFP